MPAQYAHPEALVSADWVQEHLNDPKVRIVETDEDALLYSQGHIPGAVEIGWHLHLQDQLRRDYIDADEFEELCSDGGHRQRHHGRLLRRQLQLVGLLRPLGVQAVRAQGLPDHERRLRPLDRPGPADDDGGPELSADGLQGREGRRGRASAPSATTSWPTPRPGKPMIDVRSPDEYTGKKLHMEGYPQEGSLRGGHIPGAKSVPWKRAINDDGTFKSADELKALYEGEVGLKPTDDVVAYCRIGERSSHTWFVLKYLLGYPKVRNYDGSWTEWGNLVRVPIATGAEPGRV